MVSPSHYLVNFWVYDFPSSPLDGGMHIYLGL